MLSSLHNRERHDRLGSPHDLHTFELDNDDWPEIMALGEGYRLPEAQPNPQTRNSLSYAETVLLGSVSQQWPSLRATLNAARENMQAKRT